MYTPEEIENCDLIPDRFEKSFIIKAVMYFIFIVLGLVFIYSVVEGKDFFSVLFMDHKNYIHDSPILLILTYFDHQYKKYNHDEMFYKNSSIITLNDFFENNIAQSLPIILRNAMDQEQYINDFDKDKHKIHDVKNTFNIRKIIDEDYQNINPKELSIFDKSDIINSFLKLNYNGKSYKEKDTKIQKNHDVSEKVNYKEVKFNEDSNDEINKFTLSVEKHQLINKNHLSQMYIKPVTINTVNFTFDMFENKTHYTTEQREHLYENEKYFDSYILNDFNIIKRKYNYQNRNSNFNFQNDNYNKYTNEINFYLDWIEPNLNQVIRSTLEVERISVGKGETPFTSYSFMDNYNKLICMLIGELHLSAVPALQLNFVYPYKQFKNDYYKYKMYFRKDEGDEDESDHLFKWYSPVNFINSDMGKYKENKRATKLSVKLIAGDCFYVPSLWWFQFSSVSFEEFMYITYKFKGDEFNEHLIKGVLQENLKSAN